MAATIYKTPGVYIKELSAFPPSIVGVATAVPAFIGYTERAEIRGKPVYLQPIRIESMADFEQIFGGGYRPFYDIVDATDEQVKTGLYDFSVYDAAEAKTQFYRLDDAASVDDPANARFNLYNSLRLFYANGGGTCYVVSVSPYLKTDKTPNDVTLADLQRGLEVIREQQGPTILLIPDAVLLKPDSGSDPWIAPADYGTLMKAMLEQCATKQDRVAILDVYGGNLLKSATPTEANQKLDEVIARFREQVGDAFLSYGMGYFPFLATSVIPATDISYWNINAGASFEKLKTILKIQTVNLYPIEKNREPVDALIDRMQPWPDPPSTPVGAAPLTVTQLNQNINSAVPLLGDIEGVIIVKNSVLPASGAMAGVYTAVDTARGVWNAPANVTLTGVIQPTFLLTGDQQADLNKPLDGKAVDAIREFAGRGSVVWGARTLDGNSNDYRYIQVRRTLVYIEQSIKTALNQFVFAANDGNTWTTVVAMVSSFLQGVWSQGGLMGATASEAFVVQCGLGSTMTAQDILEGLMKVQVVLQMIRPAEFIELTFTQKMEGGGA